MSYMKLRDSLPFLDKRYATLAQVATAIAGVTGLSREDIAEDLVNPASEIGIAFADVLDTYAPGRELAYAERTTNFTTTNVTAYSVAAGNFIDGLSISVTGNGRPVDIEFTGLVKHSVANTFAGFTLLQDGAAQGHIAGIFSPSTTSSVSAIIKRRLIIADGVVRVFTMGVYGGAAGTTTIGGTASIPMSLSAVSR